MPRFTVVLSEESVKRLEDVAKKNHRSRTAQVQLYLNAGIEGIGRDESTSPEWLEGRNEDLSRFVVELSKESVKKLEDVAKENYRPRTAQVQLYIDRCLSGCDQPPVSAEQTAPRVLTDIEMCQSLFRDNWPVVADKMAEAGLDVKGAIEALMYDLDGLQTRVDLLNESGG